MTRRPPGTSGTSSPSLAGVLKWVGAATAVISLLLGGNQLITVATGRAQRNRESSELVALARQQAARGEFAGAWKNLDLAEARGRSAAIDETRLDVGSRWLEEGRPGPDQPFSRITDAVVPALDRALLDPHHPRRADVLAHLGWATFLKRRDSGTGDPAAQYKEALAIDPTNVYANAMLAHWLLWQGGSLDAALPYFDAALATGKERALVRTLQLAALRDRQDSAADLVLMRVANDMRQHDEPLDERSARAVHLVFVRRDGPDALATNPSPAGLSPADQLATFVWLAHNPAVSYRTEISEYVVAVLKEAAGDVPGAIAALRALEPKLHAETDAHFRSKTVRDIARLERESR